MKVEDIAEELDGLELDAGIRIVDEEGRMIFITRSAYEFVIKVDDKWFSSKSIDKVIAIIKQYTKGKINAWLY